MQRSDREIAKGGMLISIARIGSAILGFLNTLLLTRFLGGEIYGFYSRILAPSFFLTRSFSGLGEGQALMKYLPFYKSREEEALASKAFLVALEFRLIVGFIFGFLIVVLSPEIASFLNVDSASLVRFNGLLVAFSVVSGILLTTTIALQRESLYLALLLGSRIVRIGLILVLIVLLDIGVLGAILSIIASYVMICFLALPWTFSHVKPMKLSVTDFLSTLRGLISFGLPAAMQVMMFGISQEIPLVFLASVGSNIENAILRAASTYFIIVAGIVNAFGRAMIPRLGEDMPESSRRAIVLRSMPFFSLISAGMGSLLMGLPKTFMGLLSPELSIGMNVLRIMGFTMFLTSVTPLSSLAMIYGRKELLTIGISSIMVSSFLSYLLRNMGPNYLSLSYIGSYSVLSVSLLVLAKRMGLSLKETKRGVLGSISSGIITALTLSAVDILIENLILRLFIGLMLFSLVFPLTVVLFSKIKPDQMMRIIEILPLPRSLVQMLRKYLSTLFRLAHI